MVGPRETEPPVSFLSPLGLVQDRAEAGQGRQWESPSTRFIAEGKAGAEDMREGLVLMVLGSLFIMSIYLLVYVFAARVTTIEWG